MKSIKRTMQFGALAIIAGAAVYQCSAVNIGGEDDRRSTVSVAGRGNEEGNGSLVRVGGLSVLGGNGQVVGYEGKKSRVCKTGASDADYENRTGKRRSKSYFRDSMNQEYNDCKNDRLNELGNQPAENNQSRKRGRTENANDNRRTKRMKLSDNQ